MTEEAAPLTFARTPEGEASVSDVNELLARTHRSEVKANNAVGIAQATRSNIASTYVQTKRYRQDREEMHQLLDEAARSSRRGLLLVGVVAALAIGSFFGVAAFERDAQSRFAETLSVIQADLEYQCKVLEENRNALNAGPQNLPPVDCSNIGELTP